LEQDRRDQQQEEDEHGDHERAPAGVLGARVQVVPAGAM
jgi:hypothetical protein